jgi:LmbE family N-acetylglucosaminyl deacetylase
MNAVRVVALVIACAILPLIASAQTPRPDPYLANNRPPDDRFKADILVVVAHPDDEGMAAAYIARAIDQGKRVAIVWTTRGDGGQNEVGPEQASAMGDIREFEGMQAAASLGVKLMWNLGGPDTPRRIRWSLSQCAITHAAWSASCAWSGSRGLRSSSPGCPLPSPAKTTAITRPQASWLRKLSIRLAILQLFRNK